MNPLDKKRIQIAFKFFINKLGILGEPITLKYKMLEGDNAEVFITRSPDGKYKSFVVNVNEKDDISLDVKITAVAHELAHVQQLTTGRLDIQKKMWDGKVIDQSNYWHLPWENDARMQSRDLWVEFNRYTRNKNDKV